MSEFWIAVLVGSLAVFSWKIIGYLIPQRFSDKKGFSNFAALLTVALLASLAATQSFSSGQAIVFDSRALAVAVAGVLFWRKVPFIVVIAVAATVAALMRLLFGWA